MSGIVERIHRMVKDYGEGSSWGNLMSEAANHITELEKERDKYKENARMYHDSREDANLKGIAKGRADAFGELTDWLSELRLAMSGGSLALTLLIDNVRKMALAQKPQESVVEPDPPHEEMMRRVKELNKGRKEYIEGLLQDMPPLAERSCWNCRHDFKCDFIVQECIGKRFAKWQPKEGT